MPIDLKWTSDDRQVQKAFERQERRINKLESQLKRATKAGTEGSKQVTTGFGKFTAGIGAAITKLGALTGVVGVGALVRGLEQAADRAQGLNRTFEQGVGKFRQIATTQAEFEKFTREARQLAAAGVPEGQAGDLAFLIRSAGLGKDIPLFASLIESGAFRDVAPLVGAVSTIKKAFGADAGTTRQITSKLLESSATTQKSAEEVGSQFALVAGGRPVVEGKQLFTDEEILGAFTRLTETFQEPELARTRLLGLFRSLEFKDARKFLAPTLDETLSNIGAAGLEGEELKKTFGRAEGIEAFRALLADRAALRERTARIESANASDLLTERLAFETPPGVQAAAGQRKVEAVGRAARITSGLAERESFLDAATGARAALSVLQGRETAAALSEFVAPIFQTLFPKGIEEFAARNRFQKVIEEGVELIGDPATDPETKALLRELVELSREQLRQNQADAANRATANPEAHAEPAGAGL